MNFKTLLILFISTSYLFLVQSKIVDEGSKLISIENETELAYFIDATNIPDVTVRSRFRRADTDKLLIQFNKILFRIKQITMATYFLDMLIIFLFLLIIFAYVCIYYSYTYYN